MADRSALSAVPAKALKHVEAHLSPDEDALLVLVGSSAQTLVALDDRLLIVKPGYMAGATFGAKVATFSYRDISALEVNTTMLSGVIEVIAPGYDGRKPTSYWSSDKDKDPFKISNCLPIAKASAKAWQPQLDWLRQRIAETKRSTHSVPSLDVAPSRQDALVTSLERLQKLKDAGTLTGEEFQRAKERLLEGRS